MSSDLRSSKKKKNKIWRVLYCRGAAGGNAEMKQGIIKLPLHLGWCLTSRSIAQGAYRPYRKTSIQHGPHNARAGSLSLASLREGQHEAREHLKIFHWCLSIPSPTRPKNSLEKAIPDSEMYKLKPKNKLKPKQGTSVQMGDNCGSHSSVPTVG